MVSSLLRYETQPVPCNVNPYSYQNTYWMFKRFWVEQTNWLVFCLFSVPVHLFKVVMATGWTTSCGPVDWSPSWSPILVNILFIIHCLYDCSICSERKISPTLLISTLIHTCMHERRQAHTHIHTHKPWHQPKSVHLCWIYVIRSAGHNYKTLTHGPAACQWHHLRPASFFFLPQYRYMDTHTHTNTPPDRMGDFIVSFFGLCVCVWIACWSLPPHWALIRFMIAESDRGQNRKYWDSEGNKHKMTVNLYYFYVSSQSFTLMYRKSLTYRKYIF